jgi:hypothetical protein
MRQDRRYRNECYRLVAWTHIYTMNAILYSAHEATFSSNIYVYMPRVSNARKGEDIYGAAIQMCAMRAFFLVCPLESNAIAHIQLTCN